MDTLTGKVAIVTGGNGGIGLGIALGLAGSGADTHAYDDAIVLVDLGGDDRYTGPVGATSSPSLPISIGSEKYNVTVTPGCASGALNTMLQCVFNLLYSVHHVFFRSPRE